MLSWATGLPVPAQDAGKAKEKEDLPPIPAIPGVPAMREPPRSPFPQPGSGKGTPGMKVPGFPLPGTTGAPPKAEKIRPEFQPGNTYRFLMKTELIAGNGDGFTMEHQARYDAKVRVDGKSGIVLKARTERLDLTLLSRGSVLHYRSLEPGDQDTPLGRHVRATLNRSVDLTLDEKGRVDASVEGGKGDDAALLPGIPRFGPEELVQWVAGIPQGFPEKRVAPGDAWTVHGTRQLGEFGTAVFELSCQHQGQVSFEGQNGVRIALAGLLSGHLSEAVSGQEADISSSAVEGWIQFDPLDRMVRHAEQRVQLVLSWPGPPAENGEATVVEWPVRQVSTLRLLHVVPTP